MNLRFRTATRADLAVIVEMLADDDLGRERERAGEPLAEGYERAFEAMSADPNQELIVACLDGRVVGSLQLTFIPGLSYQGAWRAQIEGVRVHASARSQGLGQRLIEWAVARARARGCRMVQLTSNKRRTRAIAFYQRLGFTASHEGMKLDLE